MKRILLAVMFSIGALGFAQNIEKIIKEQIVDKIKNYKPTDLVPYSKDGKKWALMDAKSRKVLTDFVLSSPSTFNPKFYAYIDSGEHKIGMQISPDYTISPIVETPPPSKKYKYIRRIDKPGFQVNKDGEITAYYTDYYYISKPVLYKGVYYALVLFQKEGGVDIYRNWVVIDEKGEEPEKYHFISAKDAESQDENTGKNIFFVEDFDGKKGLITLLGRKKFCIELMKKPMLYTVDVGTYNVLGYITQKSNSKVEKFGIMDLKTYEMHINLQEKYRIYEIRYTSTEELKKYDETDRNKTTIYFLAKDKSGQHFVLDIKGNPILPKE